MNQELTELSIPVEMPGPGGLYGLPAQTSVAPTVLRHMGLKLQPEWLLDGTPLLGDTGVRKARADENKGRLRWNSNAKGYLTIIKNGHVVAQVAARDDQWIDPEGWTSRTIMYWCWMVHRRRCATGRQPSHL